MRGSFHFVTRKRFRSYKWLLHLLFLLCAFPLVAQDQDPSQPYVMRVYTNLMEVPALVLDSNDKPWKHVDPSQLYLSIDMGPRFRPAFVRLQGDDPISLSILVDVSGDFSGVLPTLRESIAALVPGSLHPGDNVSFYTIDCHLVRSLDNAPASGTGLQNAFDAAMARPALHGVKKKAGGCEGFPPLINSLSVVAGRLAKFPGRRMLLLISNGADGGSNFTWPQLRTYAATAGISVFTMTTQSSDFTTYKKQEEDEEALVTLCHGTGGVMLHAPSARDIPKTLPRFFELMRGRYILEFHRPPDAKGGLHRLSVTLNKTHAEIHVGGTTVPLATDVERAKPQIAPADPTHGDLPAPPAPKPPTTPQP